jgi:hypothetical protein
MLYLTINPHFVDLCTVILLDIPQNSKVIAFQKTNSYTFTAITTTKTNLVDIQITVVGKFITDHEGLEPRYRWISILS